MNSCIVRNSFASDDDASHLSPAASIRRIFSQHQPASSPYTPCSLVQLTSGITLSKEKSIMEEEVFSIHKIQIFFKNMSLSLNLQEEVKDAVIACTDQKELPSVSGAHKAPHVKYAPEEIRSEQDLNSDDDLYSSSYFYNEISEDLKDHSVSPTKEKGSKFAATESHPFFDGRFVEIDGLIQYDPDWREKQKAVAKEKRRGRRRLSAWGRNSVATKAA